MESESPNPNPNKNVHHIGGLAVEFPYKPYGSQLAFMGKVISTLDKAQKQKHCNALLESPTGTGKTLSLLCSVLSWQQNYKSKNVFSNFSYNNKPNPEAASDPLGHGGGFVPEPEPEPEPSCNLTAEGGPPVQNQKKKAAPTIFYASRTHSQLTQAIREYRKTSYRVPMAVLQVTYEVEGRRSRMPRIQKGGCHEAHDIEDLVKLGRAVKARSMAQEAQLVFCPYSYILSPSIRRAMEVDLKGSIVILDEAHNIEDIARDAASVDIEDDVLDTLKRELEQLCLVDSSVYQPLHDMLEAFFVVLLQTKCWSGDKALGELQEAGISQQFFMILFECSTKAVKAASDAESKVGEHLSGVSVIALEGSKAGIWTQSFSLWCMNPAVSFTEIADLSMSVILTSGTLSPMTSFSSELGAKFETSMEAPHVIDVESQLWASVISTGPGNQPLNASYKTADAYDFQDALGVSLEEICKIVPEPRGSQDEFELTLKDYYDSIRQGNGSAAWKMKKGKKRGLKQSDVKETQQEPSRGGSAFLAVCRGKGFYGTSRPEAWLSFVYASFRRNSLAEVIVGIPFPNIHDIQVAEKKKFNDTYKSSKNLLSGNEWYCQQAFRALNQAADERFKQERNVAHVSKWLRKSLKQYTSFEMSLEGLRSFFQVAKERSSHKNIDGPKFLDIKEDSMKPKVAYKGTGKCKNHKNNNSGLPCGEKVLSKYFSTEKTGRCAASSVLGNGDASLPNLYSRGDVVDLTFAQTDENAMGEHRDYVDLECSSEKDLRLSESIYTASVPDSPEQIVVKETPGMRENSIFSSPAVFSNNDNSTSTIVQSHNDLSDRLSFHSSPAETSSGTLCEGKPSLMVTPERIKPYTNDTKREAEPSFNLSVNSHTEKRRKPMSFSLSSYSKMESYSNPDSKLPRADCKRMSTLKDTIHKIEFSSEVDHNNFEYTNLNVPQKPMMDNCGTLCLSSNIVMDKRLHLCCSLCTKSLGLPDNQFLVECLLTSSSKVYLASFLRGRSEDVTMKTDSVPVVISDTSSVDKRLFERPTSEDSAKHDKWCEKDGCVFRPVFCPFCAASDRFLGLRVMAADAPNMHLLNKILLYFDHVEIKSLEASKDKAPVPGGNSDLGQAVGGSNLNQVSNGPDSGQVAVLIPIEKFSYSPDQQNDEGWRITKSKVRHTVQVMKFLILFVSLACLKSISSSFDFAAEATKKRSTYSAIMWDTR
ncbi:hypothetical protein IFM89_037471 [Coptis chinensis]|uniref:Helicase ATP-binding domain-containing protein n=1 Tax=Coptis chinensis TaxID=261450 RepID=A0A835HSY5_9MAGN|nr:hypothetical protein IFM89_037471 [Coptis chinensis]